MHDLLQTKRDGGNEISLFKAADTKTWPHAKT